MADWYADEYDGKPPREHKVTIGTTMPLRDVQRLTTMAEQQKTSVSALLRHAVAHTFGTADQPKK